MAHPWLLQLWQLSGHGWVVIVLNFGSVLGGDA